MFLRISSRLTTCALAAILTLLIAPSRLVADAVNDEPADHIVRWAVLLGHRTPGTTPAGSDATDQLIDWDFRRDDAELLELFELASIETLQHGQHRFSGLGTESSITAGQDEQKVDIEAKVSIEEVESEAGSISAYRCRFVIRRGDEVLAAPMVISELGQRAIVASGIEGEILYVVMDVDRASTASRAADR